MKDVACSGCACETPAHRIAQAGTLYLRVPANHIAAKIKRLANELDWACEETAGSLALTVAFGKLADIAFALDDALSSVERTDIRALFLSEGQELAAADIFDVESLERFLSGLRAASLIELLGEDRLTAVFQPIVGLGDGAPIGFESLLRVRGYQAELHPPAELFAIARDAGILPHLDLAARKAAIEGAASFALEQKVFINFTPTSIYDPESCLRMTVKALNELGIPHENVVFEVIESERVGDIAHLTRILDFYRRENFLVALDDLGAGYSSLSMLSQLRPDYVKLDRSLLSGVDLDPYKAIIAQKLIETAQGVGIAVIAEGLETAGELAWAQASGAEYGQGYVIARPAAPPPSIDARLFATQATTA